MNKKEIMINITKWIQNITNEIYQVLQLDKINSSDVVICSLTMQMLMTNVIPLLKQEFDLHYGLTNKLTEIEKTFVDIENELKRNKKN